MSKRCTLFTTLLLSIASVASAQDGVVSPRDPAPGQLAGARFNVSNSYRDIDFTDILVSSVTLISPTSGQTTGRLQHRPIGWKMTLPPGAASKSFALNFEKIRFEVRADSNFTYPKIESAMLVLTFKGARCSAKAPARYDQSANLVDIQLGDIAALFDAQQKPIAAKCNER